MSGDRLETYTAVQHWLGISMHRLYFTNHWDFLWHIAWEVLYWKKGMCIMWGPSIHTYGAERGLPWAELGFLFYNFLLSIGSSFNGIITQPHSSKNKLRRKCILGPMIGKIKGKGGTQGGWQAGVSQEGWGSLHVYYKHLLDYGAWSHTLHFWPWDSHLFPVSSVCTNAVSNLRYFQPICIPSP